MKDRREDEERGGRKEKEGKIYRVESREEERVRTKE